MAASLIGESVTLKIQFLTTTQESVAIDHTFDTSTFTVGAATEYSKPISFTFSSGGFDHTISGTVTVNVDNDDFTVTFNGTAQPGELRYTLSSLSGESASAVTGAVESGSSGTMAGVNMTLAPTFTGDTAVGHFFLLGFQPGTNISQSVQLTLAESTNTPPTQHFNTGATLNEGATVIVDATMLDFDDAEQANPDIVYTVTSVPANGTLFLGGNPLGLNGSFTQADIDSGLVTYQHDGSETTSASFGFSVSDGSATVPGQTFNFVVTPQNDDPIASPDTAVVAEDGVPVTGNVLTNDSDAETTPSVSNPGSFDLDHGTLVINADGSYTFTVDNGNAVVNALKPGQILVDTHTYSISDGNGGTNSSTLKITIQGANDAPTLTGDFGAPVAEGSSYILTATDLGFIDPDDLGAEVTFTASNFINGVIQVNGVTQATFTGADLAGGLVTFLHDGTDTTTASFDVVVEDGNEDGSPPVSQTFTLSVTGQNDAPVATAAPLYLAIEQIDLSLKSSGLSVIDPDAGSGLVSVTLTVSGGKLTVGAGNSGVTVTQTVDTLVTLQGTVAQINALLNTDALSSVVFNHPSDDPPGSVTLTMTVDDGGNTGDGGPKTGTVTSIIMVTPVNDPPFTAGPLDVGDVAEFAANGTILGIAEFTDPEGDTLTYSLLNDAGGRFTINSSTGEVSVANGLLLDFEQATSHQIEVQADDGNPGGTQTALITIGVTDVNPETVLGDGAANTFVGGALGDTLSGAGGADVLRGGGGDDKLNGGLGADQMIGGAGNDTFVIDHAGDVVTELAGQGTGDKVVSMGVNVSLANFANVETVVLVGTGLTVTGTAGDDDILFISGGAGNTLAGGAGDDRYLVHSANTTIVETATGGDDLVYAQSVSFSLQAMAPNVETLILTGVGDTNGSGNALGNLLVGNAGKNVLAGGGGIDVLIGGLGADTLLGGSSGDRFDFNAANEIGTGAGNRDRIGDFAVGHDTIDLMSIDAKEGVAGNQGFSLIATAFTGVAGQLRTVQTGSGGTAATLVIGDTDGDEAADFILELTGHKTLTAGDFLL